MRGGPKRKVLEIHPHPAPRVEEPGGRATPGSGPGGEAFLPHAGEGVLTPGINDSDETVPNRGSPPAILLRESYRDGDRIRKRTLLNLSDWPSERVEGLRGLLKGGVVVPAGQDAFTVERSLPHGAVAAVLGTARAIGLDRLLGPKNPHEPNRPRDLVLAMIVNRVIAPASKLATAKALDPATAASSLGVELGLGEVDEDELYAALDWLHERQGAIEAALAKRHLKGGNAGALRRVVELCRRPLLSARQTRLQPRRQEGQGADRLWPAVRGRRLPGRD